MLPTPKLTGAEKYLFSRGVFRDRAKKEFFERKLSVGSLNLLVND
jgi:hypothetical protein